MLDTGSLIEKHRSKGVLVDTNLLVLLIVGLVNRRRIPEYKRTQNFTIEDFEMLGRLIEWFGRLIATPHVLSQVSDLTDLPGGEEAPARRLFASLVETMEEHYDPSKTLVTDPMFSRLGLTDVAIRQFCSKGVRVLTADLDLHLALQSRGADALNFNHVRPLGWRGFMHP